MKFKVSELILRIPIFIISTVIFILLVDKTNFFGVLLFFMGASVYDTLIFVLTRLGMLDLTKFWGPKKEIEDGKS